MLGRFVVSHDEAKNITTRRMMQNVAVRWMLVNAHVAARLAQ